MAEDNGIVILKKSGQKADFGSAYYTTMCPQCTHYIRWQVVRDAHNNVESGILKGTCCGREFHMYTERVSLVQLSGTPLPYYNARTRYRPNYTRS